MTAMNILHLDLLKPLRANYRDKTSELYFDHCHFKPFGNQVVGNIAGEFVRTLY